jgi:mRNA interferase RelE/StbE
MKYRIHRQFAKDLKKIPRSVQEQVFFLIESVVKNDSISSLGAKKMSGYGNRYRLKIGNYRLGISVEEDEIIFRRVLHRQNIYKKFP